MTKDPLNRGRPTFSYYEWRYYNEKPASVSVFLKPDIALKRANGCLKQTECQTCEMYQECQKRGIEDAKIR